MTSKERYNAWAKENVDMTLWIELGPKNTDIDEMRMVVLGDTGHTAIATIYSGENGFMVYRSDK